MAVENEYDIRIGRHGVPPGKDRASVEAREHVEYWECECGLARRSEATIVKHCRSYSHRAELVRSGEENPIGVVTFS